MRKGILKICALFFLFNIFTESCVGSLGVRNRIISGLKTRPEQYPWHVALKKTKFGPLRGAGSIIAKNWILTAAHCLYGLKSVNIIIGTHVWNNKCAMVKWSNNLYMYPEFNISTYHHDIALIKLNRPLRFSALVAPIALVSSEDRTNDFQGSRGIITGFGYINDGTPNPFNDLLQAVVTIIPNEECADFYQDYVFESTICSIGDGADGNQTICDGDSGGPLISRDQLGNIIQIGIISFSAASSCVNNYPAGYSRVSSYLDFIAEVTNITLT